MFTNVSIPTEDFAWKQNPQENKTLKYVKQMFEKQQVNVKKLIRTGNFLSRQYQTKGLFNYRVAHAIKMAKR